MKQRNKNREKTTSNRKGHISKGLAPQYMRDFDRKDSGHTPEVIKRIIFSVPGASTAVASTVVYSAFNSPAVVNTPDFIAISASGLYREFRVLAIRCRIVAVYSAPVAPTIQGLGPLIGAVGSGLAVPSNSVAAMLSCQGFRVSKGELPYLELECDAGLNPNARLWSAIQGPGLSTLTPENSLNAAWRFTVPADPAYAGKVVTQEFYEYDIEFRTGG